MIQLEEVSFAYGERRVIEKVTLRLETNEWIALMGANGSGKSTLGMLIKGLLKPDGGSITIDGITASECQPGVVGMVFQSPEDQFAAATVEREIAFGLENLGIARDEMRERVAEALRLFGLEEYRDYPPHRLSGGQMQKTALAAVMVMQPDYLLLDEPTALLDPRSRQDFLSILKRQTAVKGVFYITQFVSEALEFERIAVLGEGRILFDGRTKNFFRDEAKMREASIELPLGLKLRRLTGK